MLVYFHYYLELIYSGALFLTDLKLAVGEIFTQHKWTNSVSRVKLIYWNLLRLFCFVDSNVLPNSFGEL